MKSKLIFISLIIVVIGGGFYFYKKKNNTISESLLSNKETIIIGYSRLRISLPIFVAKEKGIFKKYGLNVKLKMYETAQPLMQALIEEKINIAGYTALPITFNGMLRSNKQLYFITTMIEDKNHRISYFLKKKDDNFIKTIKDLKDKRVGILPTIAYKAWCETILKKNNLIPNKDVKIIQIAPNLQAQTLKNGGVDALFTNDPAATSAIQVGIAELISNNIEVPKYIKNPFPFGSFNISKKWADKNPEIFKKIVLSINEACKFINKNPNKSKEMMKPYLPEQFKKHVKYYPNAFYLTTQQSSQKMYNEIADIYLKMGIIKKPINLQNLIIINPK